MEKLENKFFSLSILTVAGIFFSGFFLFCFNPDLFKYAASEKILPAILRNKFFITRIEEEVNGSTRIPKEKFRANFEQSIRSFGLPFSSRKVGVFLQERLGINDLRIYDESYRLIFSGVADKEVFNKDLRFSNNPILPGTFSKLGEFEVYRSLDGLFFFRFSYVPDSKMVGKLTIPFEAKYWVLDKQDNSMKFTNDVAILSGAVSQSDYQDYIQRADTELEKISTEKFHIFFTKGKSPTSFEFLKWIAIFVLGVFAFVGTGYFLICNYFDWKEKCEDEVLINKASEKVKLLEVFARIEKKLNGKLAKHAE